MRPASPRPNRQSSTTSPGDDGPAAHLDAGHLRDVRLHPRAVPRRPAESATAHEARARGARTRHHHDDDTYPGHDRPIDDDVLDDVDAPTRGTDEHEHVFDGADEPDDHTGIVDERTTQP